MSPAEKAAREEMAERKMNEATEKAYTKSLRNTEEAPLNNKPKDTRKKSMREAQMNSRQTEMPRVDEMGNAYKKGGKVSSASKRADGCCTKGKTKGTMINMKGGGYAC